MRLTKKRRRILATVAAMQDTGGYAPSSDTARNTLRDLLLMGYARRAWVQDESARSIFAWFITDAGREALR